MSPAPPARPRISGALALALALRTAAAAAAGPAVSSGTPVQVWPCMQGSVRQTWSITASGPPHDTVALGTTGLVLNVLGLSNASGSVLNVWTSVFNNAQQFKFAGGFLRSDMSGL
jgi:hypothetical protein